MYLKNFAIPDTRPTRTPKAWVFSNTFGEPQARSLKTIAAQRFLYSPLEADGTRSWAMEHRLADLEALAGHIWPRVLDGLVDLRAERGLRKFLALFAATLYLRSPKRVEDHKSVHRQLVELFEREPTGDDGNPLPGELEINGRTMTLSDTSDYHAFRDADDSAIARMFVSGLRDSAHELAVLLLDRTWSVLLSEDDAFITSDHPVALVHPTLDLFGFGTPGVQVYFPLSPGRVLLIHDDASKADGHYYPVPRTLAASVNQVVWSRSDRFMISPRPTDEVCAEMLQCAPPLPEGEIEPLTGLI